MVNDGFLERTNRGIYIKAGDIDDALFSLQQRAKKIVYSHETALFLHGLTDRTPFRYSITVPASYKPSDSLKAACKIYYIKVELIGLGKTELASGLGHQVMVYDRERTLCDIVRSRNKLDKQVFLDALKGYVARPGADLNRLYDYAEQFGIYRLLQQYLEVLS
jgi:predicted transcriptional regulator of viral defense system